jgi:hypothetical protein
MKTKKTVSKVTKKKAVRGLSKKDWDETFEIPLVGEWKWEKKSESTYPYKITIALLTLSVVILLLMSMHTAQTEAINGWVN